MKVEIEREVYEQLKGSAVELDMECKYYIVIPSADELHRPRKKTGKRTSPKDVVALSNNWEGMLLPTKCSRAARQAVGKILNYGMVDYITRGELAEKLEAEMGGPRNTNSGRVSRLIRQGVLEVRK